MLVSHIFRIFILFPILSAKYTVPQELSKFPLPDCTNGNINLLIITDTMPQSDCIDQKKLIAFFSLIHKMFLSPGQETRTGLQTYFTTYSLRSSNPILQFSNSINSTQVQINLIKFTNCTKTKNYQQLQTLSVLPIFDFVYSHFSESLDTKDNISNVAIMLINGPNPGAVQDVKSFQKGGYQQTNFKLFVIMMEFDEEGDQIAHIPDTLSVSSDLANNQLILMSVCKRCKPGWFLLHHQYSLHQISCYFLDISRGATMDWFGESKKCSQLGSKLVSIETEEELQFLETKLYENITSRGDFYGNLSLFIGVRRYSKNMYKGFQWLSGNPMIISHWADKSPKEAYYQECGLWVFEAPGTNVTTGVQLEFSERKVAYTNGWKDVSCGLGVTNASLCETVLQKSNSVSSVSLEINQARTSSVNNAIRRGEFVDYQSKIVSIAAYAEHSEFYSSLGDVYSGFELFDCEEDEGKGKSITYSYVCDHVQHCSNGRDEGICLYKKCDPSLEFECRSRQCVPRESRCDVYRDCYDNSDEEDCMECKQRRCCEGECVPKHWFNDNETSYCNRCSDDHVYEDENSRSNNDEPCVFICNRTSCVNPSQLDDGILQCTGPEGHLDETIGMLERSNSCYNTNGEVKWAPRCVYVRDRYGSVLGCQDMSHLWNCENFVCSEGYVKCPNSYCIALHRVLDGKKDCPLGEDEQDLENHSCVGNFACSNSQVCLHPDLVCDGAPQCPQSDDELNCNVTCASGFRCISGTVSVMEYDLTIPLKSLTFVDPRTRYLDLSGVDVSDAVFGQDVTHLKSLITIRMSYCKITTVNGFFSRGISNLHTVYNLDLSYNLLVKISKYSIFRYMSNLRVLNLSHNDKLAVLEDNAFLVYYGESSLEKLELHNTAITTLRSSVLEGLTSLKVLNLSNTMILNLFQDSFPKDFNLHVLDIRDTYIIGYDTSSFNGLSVKTALYTDSFGLCCPLIRGSRISEKVCCAPTDTISSCSHLVREVIQRVLLWMVGVVAVLGNVIVILCRVLCDRSVIRKAYVIFVISLGISDLIMGLYLLIIACADFYYRDRYVLNGKVWKESAICQIAGFLSTLSSETSAFFTLLVTLERYLVMKFPFGQWNFSNRGMVAATALVWIAGFILAVIPILPSCNTWAVFSSNSMCLGLPLDTNQMAGGKYSVAVFVVLNSVVFLVIVAGQFSIYRAMSESRMATSAVQNSNRQAQDTAVARQLSLVVLSNFLCWFPIGVMGLLSLTGHEIGKNAYTWVAVLVLPINSALNPMLYTVPILHDRFKQFMIAYSKSQIKENKCKNSTVLELPKLSKDESGNKEKTIKLCYSFVTVKLCIFLFSLVLSLFCGILVICLINVLYRSWDGLI